MEKDKFLFVVSGAAGTGKDSVVKALREAHPEIEKTVSATTRSTRAVLIMDSDHVVLSALQPETVASRAAGQAEGKTVTEEEQ